MFTLVGLECSWLILVTQYSFDEILGLGFDLGHLKMNTYYIKKVNFAKDYQNDSYNKNILMRKKLTR